MKHKEVNIYHLIHKVKHGYKILSANKALNLSQYHIVASILGIGIGMTGLYMALQESNIGSLYLPWMTGGNDSSEIIYVAGLKNLGNNCFLNVILQVSSFTPPKQFFKMYVDECNITGKSLYIIKQFTICMLMFM